MPTGRIAAVIGRRYGEKVDPPAGLPFRDALARSWCRRYRPDPVPAALVRLLCASALVAPTFYNKPVWWRCRASTLTLLERTII